MSTFRSQQGKTIIRMDILPPERTTKRSTKAGLRRGEVIDAQFVPVPDRKHRSGAPRSHNDNRKRSSRSGGLFAGYAAKAEAGLKTLPADLFSALVAVAFIGVFALAGGFTFLFDHTGMAEAGPALDITHVSMTPQDANGMRILLINGIVENHGGDRRAMPSIRVDLISGEVVVATTMINPPTGMLEGRQSRGFTARVPHPGGKLPDLRLSLAERDASRS